MRYIPLAFVALAGCATVADIQSSAVDETFQSAKPIAQISQCISYKLAAAPISDQSGDTLFIIKNAYQAPLGTITLQPNDAGTLISIRRSNSLGMTGGWKSCS